MEQEKTHQAYTIFDDPIHGPMKIPEACVKIINTKWFHRLRYVKQLGGVYYVFPSATHTRFEHSIGTCWLAGKLLKLLKRNMADDDSKKVAFDAINSKTILCVQIAALCHDLGHGPWSHLYDQRYLPKLATDPEKVLSHEQMAVKIFDKIYEDLKEYFTTKHKFVDGDVEFIQDLILPKKLRSDNVRREFKFLYQIVNNSQYEVDVDKWDYILRDAYYTNQRVNLKRNYLSNKLEIDKKGDKYVIHVKEEALDDLYEIFSDRKKLHKKVYQHENKNAVELMVVDALAIAEKDLNYHIRGYKLSELASHDDYLADSTGNNCSKVEAFLLADDNIIQEIRRMSTGYGCLSTSSDMNENEKTLWEKCYVQRKSKWTKISVIFDRIESRDFYYTFVELKFVDAKLKQFGEPEKMAICELFEKFILNQTEKDQLKLFKSSDDEEFDKKLSEKLMKHLGKLRQNDFIVDIASFNYGSGIAHAAKAAPYHLQHTTYPREYADNPQPIILWTTIIKLYCKKTLYKKLLRALPIRMYVCDPEKKKESVTLSIVHRKSPEHIGSYKNEPTGGGTQTNAAGNVRETETAHAVAFTARKPNEGQCLDEDINLCFFPNKTVQPSAGDLNKILDDIELREKQLLENNSTRHREPSIGQECTDDLPQ